MGKFILTGFADEISSDLKIQMDELQKLNIKHIEMRGIFGKNLVESFSEKCLAKN